MSGPRSTAPGVVERGGDTSGAVQPSTPGVGVLHDTLRCSQAAAAAPSSTEMAAAWMARNASRSGSSGNATDASWK